MTICTFSDFKLVRNSYYGNCFTFNSGDANDNDTVRTTTKYGSRYGERCRSARLLTIRKLMLALCVFVSTCITPDNQFLKIKYALNLEKMICVGT